MKLLLLISILLINSFVYCQTDSECEDFRSGTFKFKDGEIKKTPKKQVEKDVGVKIHFDVINYGDCETLLIFNANKSTSNGDLNPNDTVYCKLLEVRSDTFFTRQKYHAGEYLREYIKIK